MRPYKVLDPFMGRLFDQQLAFQLELSHIVKIIQVIIEVIRWLIYIYFFKYASESIGI